MKYRGKTLLLDESDKYILTRHSFWWHHSGYLTCKIKGKHVSLHRLLLAAKHGEMVDHINRKKFDNRMVNLRFVTRTQNIVNRDMQINNSTGYRGVFYFKRINRFVAMIGKQPREYLGCFKTAAEAATIYNKRATKKYGKYAVLNNV